MDLYVLNHDERRSLCRRELEALELWLRRLVHETFSTAYGAEYLDALDESGRRIIKKRPVAEGIRQRLAEEPLRYGRPVDAAHLDDLVTIICNLENWKRHFGAALGGAFQGSEQARYFLGRLVPIRNKLSHANPISVHEAARIICYTLDVIEALKSHYMERNLEHEYNVPTIIRVADSLGNMCDVSAIRRPQHGRGRCDLRKSPSGSLSPGDRLSIEAQVDPSFERSSYQIRWVWRQRNDNSQEDTDHIIIDLENKHVGSTFEVNCLVISTKDWHRFGDYDDVVGIVYKVLPPLF